MITYNKTNVLGVHISVIIILYQLLISFYNANKVNMESYTTHTMYNEMSLLFRTRKNAKIVNYDFHDGRTTECVPPDHNLTFPMNEYMRNRHDTNFIENNNFFGLLCPFVVYLVRSWM